MIMNEQEKEEQLKQAEIKAKIEEEKKI